MKNLLSVYTLFSFLLLSCAVKNTATRTNQNQVNVSIDLANVIDDKVKVTVSPSRIKAKEIKYHFAKIIPGTYAIADYGRFVDAISAYDNIGKILRTIRTDSNTVLIPDAGKLAKLTYEVNDTFDSETGADVFSSKENVIFSPAGTNILAGQQFLLNMSGFVGYFDDGMETPYQISIAHPEDLFGSTALNDTDKSSGNDVFTYNRFAEVVDNPIMYSKPDTANFTVDGMEVLLSVYSRNNIMSAARLKPELQRMVVAQKKFLGEINTTKKYAVLTYLTTLKEGDARGMGALEHNTSTTAVFREAMSGKDLIDVISHEFFHTVTPLKVHSKEIRYFDFENPKMSRHLWFYEGITEYFAHLFQVNQKLISEDEFYDVIADKIQQSANYKDSLSITEMSKNVLVDSMKNQYPNVYQKGALIAMCLDIILRENSQGKRGLLTLMGELVKKYGADKPFDDAELIGVITSMTTPEVGSFLTTHVEGAAPINYSSYLKRMGVGEATVPVAEPVVFISDGNAYISIDDIKKQIVVDLPDNDNKFFTSLGLKDKDVLLRLNGLPFDPEDGGNSLLLGYGLIEGSPIKIDILRNGQAITLNGKVNLNYKDGPGYRFSDTSKTSLKDAWLLN